MDLPVSIEPVKLIAATSGWLTKRIADDRPGAHHQVEDARGNAGAGQDVGQHPRAAGRPLRRLEDDRVAERERGRDLPGGNGDRKVPRRDQADDADRLAGDLDVDAGADGRQLLPGQPQHFAGEELEDVPGTDGLAHALGQRLPFFAREQPADLVLARENIRADLVEDVGAILDATGRPRGKCGLCRSNRVLRLRGIGHGVLADDVAQIGRIAIGRPRRRHDPLAVDVVGELFEHVLEVSSLQLPSCQLVSSSSCQS